MCNAPLRLPFALPKQENFADFSFSPIQIAVTVTGIGSFVVVASALL
jgi:hypothetical protein